MTTSLDRLTETYLLWCVEQGLPTTLSADELRADITEEIDGYSDQALHVQAEWLDAFIELWDKTAFARFLTHDRGIKLWNARRYI